MLWGRLDAAERIITALLAGHPRSEDVRALIGEAQAAIVLETIEGLSPNEWKGVLVEAAMRPTSRTPEPAIVDGFVNALLQATPKGGELATRLQIAIGGETLRQYYLDTFKVRRELEAGPALESAARASTVVGRMLEGLSEEYKRGASLARWITRIGQLFWVFVEVAVPQSFASILFHHWLKLAYFLEVLLIVGSTLLQAPPVQQFALVAFAVTLAAHGVVLAFGDIRQHKKRWRVVVGSVATAIVLFLVVFGALGLSMLLGGIPGWNVLDHAHQWAVTPQARAWLGGGLSAVVTLFFLLVIRQDLGKSRQLKMLERMLSELSLSKRKELWRAVFGTKPPLLFRVRAVAAILYRARDTKTIDKVRDWLRQNEDVPPLEITSEASQ
jgi:hypothetical protein